MKADLQERRERIIETVVMAFMETGKPVSSAFVSSVCGLGLSPASIRSIMKELEKEGLLAQRHTSAGRIPTVKCYRYYVKHLMKETDLSELEQRVIKNIIEEGMRDHDTDLFINHMVSTLSEVTDLIGVALSPGFERGIFDKIEILNLGGSSYLLVLSLKSGFVNTIRITIDHIIPRWKIEETARIITERLHDLSISDINDSIGLCLRDVAGGDRSLVEVILTRSDRIFSFSDERNIHLAGLSRVLTHPDFEPADHSLKLIDMFEHKNEIVKALKLSASDESNVSIHIGGNGPWGSRPPLSLVSAVYWSGSMMGVIGVIGPARVHYPRLTALVRYASASASNYLSSC